jgi:rhomboid protease GluP
MAFGLSPKYTQDLTLDNLTPEQFLVLAIEAVKKLGWNLGYKSETGFIAFTNFSMSSMSEEVKVKIDGNTVTLKSECTGNQLVDWGKNKKNIESLVATVNDLKSYLAPEELAQKYEELKPDLVSNEEDILSQPVHASKDKLTGFMAIFKPVKGYFITPLLINLNIAIFILMVISGVNFMLPDNASLIKWGANFRPVTLEGEWWRLTTSCFLHIGVFHLLMNMYALLYIGLLLEPHLGKLRFSAAYLLTGITGSITSLWWHDLTISAGASGAIFGLYGVFLALLTTNFIEKSARKALLTSIGIFVAYNLLNGLKAGIDNAAHIGGLIGGLIIGYAYIPGLKKPEAKNLKYSIVGALAVLVLSVSFVMYQKTPKSDIAEYNTKIQSFVSMEEMALKVFSLPENTPKEKILSEIKDTGIHYWNENIQLLTDLEKLNLPDAYHERNKKLLHYCDLRIKYYNLIYKAVDEDTDRYQDSIDVYGKEIEAMIKDLTGK